MKLSNLSLFLATIFLSSGVMAQQKAEESLSITLNSKQDSSAMPYQSKVVDNNMASFNDKLWNELYKTIVKGSIAVDQSLASNGQDVMSCSLHRVKSFYGSQSDFDKINLNLPTIQSSPTSSINVNTNYNLNTNNTNNLSLAYIPSVFAAELLFKKPMNPDADLLPSQISDVVYSQNIHNPNSNIRKNWTSIALPKELNDKAIQLYRLQGRTPALDAGDLRESTLKDLTTIGYVIATNPQYGISVDDFLKSAMVIYSRDKFMCVYDIQNLMLTVF